MHFNKSLFPFRGVIVAQFSPKSTAEIIAENRQWTAINAIISSASLTLSLCFDCSIFESSHFAPIPPAEKAK